MLLAGCAAKRDNYDVPALDLPKQYAKAPAVADVTDTGNATPHLPPPPTAPVPSLAPALSHAPLPSSTPAVSSPLGAVLAEWWRLLGSQELNSLMDRALANNPDMRIAALRIAQSKARLDQAGADKAPVITMPVQVKNEYPEFGPSRGNTNGNNRSRMTHLISLKGDWRPDIWGETYSLYESAELQLLRATYQRDDMQRNVVANVAANYMEYLSLNDRLRVARDTEKSLEEMLVSVNARLEAGDATITEMEQQKAAVYSTKATIPVLEQQREVVLNRLASLLGSAPVELKLSDKGLNSAKFPAVLPGVPSALLLRRPDVRVVEARLLAADADIDVARARVLPPLDLTAQIGYGSTYLSKLFMPQALFWSTIANLSVTVFDSGKRSKEVEFAQAIHEELLETYVRVIYDAVREVDDSLSAISFMGKRLEAQGVAADSSLRAWNFSQEAFMAGAVDYLTVLDTQRTYQRNLDDWYNVRMERYRGLINLFSALGGGVHGGDALPGEGTRPAPMAGEADHGAVLAETGAMPKAENDAAQNQLENQPENQSGSIAAKVDTASHNNAQTEGVDWAGNTLRGGATHWLVELSGVYDRGAVLPAWRDLHVRFSRQLIESRILLPHRQGQVNAAGKERASWYRLFIATFSDKQMAEEFCAALSAGQQRCGVVSSQSLAGKGDFVAPSILEQSENIVAGIGVAIKTEDAVSSDKNDKDGRATEAEAVRAQAGQEVEKQAAPEVKQPEIKQPETKQPAEAEAAKLPASSPEILVERWVKDWSEKNMEGYLSHYDIGFRPADGKDREAWETKRRSRIGEASSIKVHTENLKVERQSELAATARFVETIEVGGYKKTSRKQLLLVRRDMDGEWKIREEREETKAESLRIKAEEQTRLEAEAKAAKIKAKEEAQVEAVRVKAERKAKAEADAQAAAEAKAAKLKAKHEAEAEAARLKAERQAHAKVEKQAAAEEKARLEAEGKAAKIKAIEKSRAEATRVKEEKKVKAEADAQAAAEAKVTKLKARREAVAEAVRAKAEQKVKVQAEKQAAAEVKQAAKAALAATTSGKKQFDGVDWSDQQFWLVEMSDMLDRDAVTAAWRDLRASFPEQMENRTIHPRRQDRMSDAGEEGVSRYQLFIAKFPEKQMAEEFCAMLRAGQQRCGVVSSRSLAGKDDLDTPSATDKEGSDQP
ncbi:MAG: efflux transporter outer membrane subunit [Gallionella sp.]|nr:efflux transporter outer membrane subunit [Gallionella sp.]